MAKIILANEGSTPATPASGSVVLYTVGGVMHLLDSSGTPHPVDSSGITAGPTGSGATYTGATALADAIAAATAVAPATVGVLPGQYTEDLTLPAGVSLVATFGTVQLNGSITLTGLTSFQTVSGFICQNIYLTAGAPSSAFVILNHCQIEGDDTDPAVVVSDAGWNVLFASCGVDGVTRRAVMSAAADIQGTNSSFRSSSATAFESQGSVGLQQCSLDGGMTLSSTAQADLLDTTVHFDSGTAPYAFFLDGTSQLRLKGGFSISGIDSTAGTLWKGTGTFQTNAGTFLGAYNSAFLPTVDASSEGAIAYAVDMGSLAVVASGNWAPVGGGGGGGITDPGGETPGAMLYYRDPGAWDLVQHTRSEAALKFSLEDNNGTPYWDFPAPPKNFTLFYEGAATAGVDASNVPMGTSPGTIPSWLGSKAGGTPTGLTTVVGKPTLNSDSVEFGNGDSVSGTPTLLELPAGASARTVVVVFSNAMAVTGPTSIVSYGAVAALQGFTIGVLSNGNLGWWADGTGMVGVGEQVDFGIAAAAVTRRMLIVTYDGTKSCLYWTLNANEMAWSTPHVVALNTGAGVPTPLIIGGATASYSVEAVVVFNTAMNNDLSSIQELQAYASSLRMSPGTAMTFPGGEYGYGTLFYANTYAPAGLIALPSSTPGDVLTVGAFGAPEWSDPDLVCTAAELATTYAPSAVLRGVVAYTSDTLATYVCRRTAASAYSWAEVGGTALPTASGAGELPVSDGAGSAYTATSAGDVVDAAIASVVGAVAGQAIVGDGLGGVTETSADVSAVLAAANNAAILAALGVTAGETALPRLALDGALHHWRLDESSSPFADLGPSPVALVQTTGAREYGRAGVYARYGATMMRAPAANDRADAAISDVTGTGDITLGVTVAAEGGALRSSDYAVIVALHTGVAYQDSLMILARNESVAAYAYQTGVGNRITADVAIPWSVPHRIEAIYRVSTGLTTLYVDGVARAVTDYSLPMGALPYASLGGVAQTIPGVVAGSVLASDFTVHASALSSAQQIARADIVRRLAMG